MDFIAKGDFSRSERSTCVQFLSFLTHTVYLFQVCVANISLFGMYSFPMMLLMKCEETDLIKLLYKGNCQSQKDNFHV